MAQRNRGQQDRDAVAAQANVPYYRALFGALGWGVLALALTVLLGRGTGEADSTRLLVQIGWILIACVLAAWPTWYAARRRGWPELWKLFLLAAPAFWVLRALTLILDRLLFG